MFVHSNLEDSVTQEEASSAVMLEFVSLLKDFTLFSTEVFAMNEPSKPPRHLLGIGVSHRDISPRIVDHDSPTPHSGTRSEWDDPQVYLFVRSSCKKNSRASLMTCIT